MKYVVLMSVGYKMDTMYFSQLQNPLEFDRDVALAHFTMTEAIMYDCSQNYTSGLKNLRPVFYIRVIKDWNSQNSLPNSLILASVTFRFETAFSSVCPSVCLSSVCNARER